MPLSSSKKECQNQTKICSKCQIKKPLTEYYKNDNRHHAKCKECFKVDVKIRWQNLSDKQKAKRREYSKKYLVKYREDNKEKLSEYARKYREKNRESLREYFRNRYYQSKQRKE